MARRAYDDRQQLAATSTVFGEFDPVTDSAARQKQHDERIDDRTRSTYYDPTSPSIRDWFIYRDMFEGLDLNGKISGGPCVRERLQFSGGLKRFRQASVSGSDISSAACGAYERETGGEADAVISRPGRTSACGRKGDNRGGLHHCVADRRDLSLHSHVVKPGACADVRAERQYLLERGRRLW